MVFHEKIGSSVECHGRVKVRSGWWVNVMIFSNAISVTYAL